MTDERPGAEYFGRQQPPPRQPSQTFTPTFGMPSGRTPGTPGPTTVPPATPSWPTSGAAPTTAANAEPSLGVGVMGLAKADDPQALATLFGQFIPAGEQIVETRYMGVQGFWGIGTHSFAAVTPRRVASLRVGLLGAVVYQDGALEYINSSIVYQPSRLELYLPAALWMVWDVGISIYLSQVSLGLALITFVLGSIFVPVIVMLQHRRKKSGLALWIREGLMVHVFMDRERIVLANRYYRLCSELRDERIREIGHP